MNDLTILHDAWGAAEAPSPESRADARAALLVRAQHSGTGSDTTGPVTARPRRRRMAAVAAALAAAAAVAVVANLGGTGPDGRPRTVVPGLPAVPAASAAVLERAAVAAEQQPFTAPRPDQWFYFEDRLTGDERTTQRRWRRVDGSGTAVIDEHGRLQVQLVRPSDRLRGTLEEYATLAALPTDPDALLGWAYDQAEHVTGAGLSEHGDVYAVFNHILRDNVLPPPLEAAIYRALKRVPGVTVTEVDVLGRPALALGQTEDWLREELLLDRETYRYRGERSTVVRNATIDPLKAGNATGQVTRGSTVVRARLATAIVDEPGERPESGPGERREPNP